MLQDPRLGAGGRTRRTRQLAAACEVLELAEVTHKRPPWGIDSVDGQRRGGAGARGGGATSRPSPRCCAFARTRRARRSPRCWSWRRCRATSPRCCATPCAPCCRTTTSTSPTGTTCATCRSPAGRFGLDEYTEHLIDFLAVMGPGAHVIAVCQPCVAALAAVALMSEDQHPATPASLTLMAGPIDCRISPTEVNKLATTKPIEWFEKQPDQPRAAGATAAAAGASTRASCSSSAFMSMNKERHVNAFKEYYRHLVDGEFDKAEVTRTLLRGVHGGGRPVGRVLPRDRAPGVPGVRAAARAS